MKNAKHKTLGRGGIAFSNIERKSIRKGFTPVSLTDHLAMYVDGLKISPESWDRFGDKNQRKGKSGAAFNLRWIKQGGAKLDQVAKSVQSEVPGYSNVDENDIILEIIALIDLYPEGMTEYYHDATRANEAEANYYNMKEKPATKDTGISLENMSDKEFERYMNIKPAVKKVKPRKSGMPVTYTKELGLIRRLNSLNGQKVTTRSLRLIVNLAELLYKNKKCGHKPAIKKIIDRLGPAVEKLEKQNVNAITKLELKPDLFRILEKPVHAPRIKNITLGKAGKKGATASKKKVPAVVGIMKPF